MKKFVGAICGYLLLTQALQAALPPLAHSTTEIKAILEDERLNEFLDASQFVLQIRKSEKGYLIFTQKSLMAVDVKYLPREEPGPAKFELKFHKPQPLLLSAK